MSDTKKPTEVGYSGLEGLGLDANRGVSVSLRCEPKDRKSLTSAKILRKCKNMACLLSPVRGSFRAVGESCLINLIPDPKPDRTDPPSVKQVTLLVLAVTCLQVKGTHPHKAWSGIQAVERGVVISKIQHREKIWASK